MAEIKLTITAEDHASRALSSAESSAGRLDAAFSRAQATCVAWAAKLYTIKTAAETFAAAAGRAWGMVDSWASYAEQASALDALGQKYHSSSEQIVSSIQEASKGLIGMKDAVSVATSSISRGLDPSQIQNLARAAEMLSDTAGVSVPQAFQMLSESVALGRERSAEALVGIIDLNAAYGDQVSTMTDAEKAHARYEIVMSRVNEIQGRLGESTDSVADKMARIGVQMGDLKVIAGEYLYRAFMSLYGAAHWLAAGVLNLAGGLMKVGQAAEWVTDRLGITDSKTKFWKENAEAAFGSAEEMAGKAADAFSLMGASSADLAQAAGGIRTGAKATDEMGNAAAGAAGKAEELEKAMAWLADRTNRLNLDDYNYKLNQTAQEYQKIADVLGWTKELESAFFKEMEGLREEHARALKDKEDSALRQTLEKELQTSQARIDALGQWRSAALKAYDDAIAKATQYYNMAKTYDDLLARGKQFLAGLNARPMTMDEEKASVMKALDMAWYSKDAAEIQKAMQSAEDLLSKYRDARNMLGSAVDFSGVTESYETLLTHVDNLKSEATATGDSWTAMAETQRQAVQTIDDKVAELKGHIESLQMQLDTNPAIEASAYARQYVDSLFPNEGLWKTVYIQYQTVTSPPMPFSEGMDYIRQRMEGLPKETRHTVRYDGLSRTAGEGRGEGAFSPKITININGAGRDGRSLAKEIDEGLADLWASGRSRLKKAVSA
jgi:hypothetical protein